MESKVAQERAQREATLAKQRTTVQALGDANRALLARQFGANSVPSLASQGAGPQGFSQGGVAGAGGAAAGEQQGSQQVGVHDMPPVLSVEEAVQRLCEATATASVGAMLDRLLPQHGTFKNLTDMRAAAAKQVGCFMIFVKWLLNAVGPIKSGEKTGCEEMPKSETGRFNVIQ